jgi:hypothetical protein
MPRAATWETAVTDYLERLEKGMGSLNGRIDNLYNHEIAALKERIVRLETRVSIYAAIAGFIGMAVGGALVKLVIHLGRSP